MAVLEDSVNIPLFGLFLLIFTEICFDAFSAVTVWYSHRYSRQNVNYSYTYVSFDNRESRAKMFTCFCAKVNIRL